MWQIKPSDSEILLNNLYIKIAAEIKISKPSNANFCTMHHQSLYDQALWPGNFILRK